MTSEEFYRYLPLILFLLNGLIAGWLASRIFGGLGWFRNMVVGVLGSMLAGYAISTGTIDAPALTGTALIDQVLYSAAGAFLILIFARFIGR